MKVSKAGLEPGTTGVDVMRIASLPQSFEIALFLKSILFP